MTTRELAPDVEATLQMLAGLGRSSLEALAFEALQQAQKHAAAVALADSVLELKRLSETHGAGRKGGLPLRDATHVRDVALIAYREAAGK